ncbi:MAG TPA: AsmA family protein [Terriglobales bacterium]
MKALKILGIVVVLLIVALIALPFLINVNTFRPTIEAELTTALGRQVKIGNLKLSILSGNLSADDLSIADDPAFSKNAFIQAKGLNVGVEVEPLIFSKTLHVTELTLQEPQVTLLRSTSGKWNFSSLGSNKPNAAKASNSSDSFTQNLAVGKLNIKDGQVSIGDASAPGKTHVYQQVNVTVQNFSFTSQFPFSLATSLPGGGSLNLEGTAGPVNSDDAASTPLQARLKIKDLDLGKSGLIDPASGIAGIADFDGNLIYDGKMAHSTGTANMTKLKLVPKGTPANQSVSLKYAADYDQQKQSGMLKQGDVNIGKALAQLTGSFESKATSTVLDMKLNAQNMPVNDLEAMLPAMGVILPTGSQLQGGTLSATLGITGPLPNIVVTGPIKLADTKLAGFNLGSKMSAISALSGMKSGSDTSIQNFSADLHYAPSGIQTQNINLTAPSLGVVTGSGTISPDNVLDYKMAANVSGTAVTGLAQMANLNTKGGTIPFFVKGTTSDPKFVPDVKGMATGALSGLTKQTGTDSVVNTIGGFFKKKKTQ